MKAWEYLWISFTTLRMRYSVFCQLGESLDNFMSFPWKILNKRGWRYFHPLLLPINHNQNWLFFLASYIPNVRQSKGSFMTPWDKFVQFSNWFVLNFPFDTSHALVNYNRPNRLSIINNCDENSELLPRKKAKTDTQLLRKIIRRKDFKKHRFVISCWLFLLLIIFFDAAPLAEKRRVQNVLLRKSLSEVIVAWHCHAKFHCNNKVPVCTSIHFRRFTRTDRTARYKYGINDVHFK